MHQETGPGIPREGLHLPSRPCAVQVDAPVVEEIIHGDGVRPVFRGDGKAAHGRALEQPLHLFPGLHRALAAPECRFHERPRPAAAVAGGGLRGIPYGIVAFFGR